MATWKRRPQELPAYIDDWPDDELLEFENRLESAGLKTKHDEHLLESYLRGRYRQRYWSRIYNKRFRASGGIPQTGGDND